VLLTKERTFKGNLLLASLTALTAGMTNVAGAMACYLFTANVTGHAASFAKHLVQNKWFEMLAAFASLFMFLVGSFTAGFLIRSLEHKGAYKAFAVPFMLQIIVLVLVSFYGISSNGSTEYQAELLAAGLLFSMGLQNSTVTIITGGTVKTSHLTGLFTDLGVEIAEWLHPKAPNTDALKNKLRLRLTILANYIIGGVVGGYLFVEFNFLVFFAIAVLLICVLAYDIFKIRQVPIGGDE